MKAHIEDLSFISSPKRIPFEVACVPWRFKPFFVSNLSAKMSHSPKAPRGFGVAAFKPPSYAATVRFRFFSHEHKSSLLHCCCCNPSIIRLRKLLHWDWLRTGQFIINFQSAVQCKLTLADSQSSQSYN